EAGHGIRRPLGAGLRGVRAGRHLPALGAARGVGLLPPGLRSVPALASGVGLGAGEGAGRSHDQRSGRGPGGRARGASGRGRRSGSLLPLTGGERDDEGREEGEAEAHGKLLREVGTAGLPPAAPVDPPRVAVSRRRGARATRGSSAAGAGRARRRILPDRRRTSGARSRRARPPGWPAAGPGSGGSPRSGCTGGPRSPTPPPPPSPPPL